MLDWFVVLIPFALLPLFAMFAFIGCVLDTQGKAWWISFVYEPGLDKPNGNQPALTRIKWEYELHLEWEDAEIGDVPFTEGPFNRGLGHDPIEPDGDTVKWDGDPKAESGKITCTCTVVMANDEDPIPLGSLTKQKCEDENGPTFNLTRDGTSFRLT